MFPPKILEESVVRFRTKGMPYMSPNSTHNLHEP